MLWPTTRRPSLACWLSPAMMKTWIGPSWTGSVELATAAQVNIKRSAITLLPVTMFALAV